MTDDSAFKKQVRARMAETGENYTVARRAVIAARDPGQPPVALRVHLNPYVDLELTTEEARAFEAADEQGRRDMANRLLADHIELAGAGEAGVAAGPGHIEMGGAEQTTVTSGSELLMVQELRVEEIAAAIRRRIPPAAGIHSIGVGGDLDHVRVDIHAARPGMALGHGGAEVDRLRDELEELTDKPVLLNILEDREHPQVRRKHAESGRTAG
ncbi:MAG: KH domain-containing protein [Streptosporangiaceae bacterium]